MRRNQLALAAALAVTFALLAGQTVSAAHAVLHSGSGLLKGTWSMDFDNGQFNTTVTSREDMMFDIVGSGNSMRFLKTRNGSTFAKMGSARPSYATCSSTTLHTGQYALSTIPLGTWFCLRANANHLVRFRLDHKHPYPGGVDLTFTTWV